MITSKGIDARKGALSLNVLLLSLITLGDLLLRLPTLKMGLWLDEFISIYLATRPSIQATYELLWRGMEFNPPLNHLLMRLYISLFGANEIIVRLPSLFWGVLLPPAIYWLGATMKARKAGLLAALFAALSAQGNYFSCQTRPYSLSTLLNCICLVYFCRLLDSERTDKKADLFWFILLATLLLYTSTFGVFSMMIFVVAYTVLWLQRLPKPDVSTACKVNLSLRQFALAFVVPGLFLLPWLPTMLHQARIVKPTDPLMLGELPWSFGACLTIMLPTPLLLSIWIAKGLGVLLFAWLGALIVRGQLKSKWKQLCETMAENPDYVVLTVATLLPAAIMGLFVEVWLGYFRYIYPFAPAQWLLIALILLGRDETQAQQSEVEIKSSSHIKKPFSRQKLIGLVSLILGASLTIAYIMWTGQKSQSGLKLVAQAIRDGKFDNSVILLAPDLPGPTLYYYSKESERVAHHVDIKGFVREHPDTPTIGDTMAEQWSSKTVVDDYVGKVEKIAQQGYQYLAFAQDSLIYGTDKMPLKPRTFGLFDKLKARYKIVRTETYPGVTETMNVSFFKLN